MSFIYDLYHNQHSKNVKGHRITRLVCFLLNALLLSFSLSVLITYKRDISVNSYLAYFSELFICFIFRCFLTTNFRKLAIVMHKVSKLKMKNFNRYDRK